MTKEKLEQLEILIKAQKHFPQLKFQKKGDCGFFRIELRGGELGLEGLVDFAVAELNNIVESFAPELQRRISEQVRGWLADVEDKSK